MVDIRVCIICGKELTGRQRKICANKECQRKNEHDFKYRQNNRDRIRENHYEWRQNNMEKVKEYYQTNREKRLEYGREYYQDNQEDRKEYERKRYRVFYGLSEDYDLSKESSLETIMREWLQENNIEFIKQYFINLENSTWTWVDFFIEPNICLYVDGGYYHSLPRGRKCDENQNRILPQMGYNVIRLSETEILNGVRPDLKKKLEV